MNRSYSNEKTNCRLPDIAYKDIVSVSSGYESYHIFIWKEIGQNIDKETVDGRTLDAQGDCSQTILRAISLQVDLKIKKHRYLTGIG